MQNLWSGQDKQGDAYQLATENWPKLLGFALEIIECKTF
jgi:hypothetical protein